MNTEDKVYHQILDHVLHLLEHDLPVTMVAASLMAIAQRLYRTHLKEEDYHRIMKILGFISFCFLVSIFPLGL